MRSYFSLDTINNINNSISLYKRVSTSTRILKEKSERIYRPSEHPPVRGKKMSKRLAGIKAAKTKPLHGIGSGSPMVVTLGQQYNVGEKPTVILCVCVFVCVFLKLHITAQSGLVILVILCHSR